jgi:glyoxylase-like metal-dependent hydrolase (beta-lactamase superfamily II)
VQDLFFLSCGSLRAPRLAFGPTPDGRLGLTVGVVVRDDGAIVLVDSGWSRAACRAPARTIGRLRAAYLGVRSRAPDAIASQLAARGLDPGRVVTIVATHLHLDHVGGVVDFPNAEVVCSERELAAYRAKRDPGYRAADLARASRVRAIALTKDPVYGFPASHDLYGDGEVVLLDARGHTPGNTAVALRSANATYVHIGDAAYLRWEYGLSPAGPCRIARVTAWNKAELERTYACIRACEADPRRPTIVPSHDPDVFATLPQKNAPSPTVAPS